jgi:hypothetical protein
MMEEKGNVTHNAFHLAGVVPIAGQPLEFKYPWHPSLNPIGADYFALQRAIYECALVGCETIWLVCHVGTQPLIRKIIGEWIHDPASISGGPRASEVLRRIQIYYVPIHPKDKQRRDCLGWSALYGALSAYWISRRLSKWVTPELFYVAFPYGVYPVDFIREKRRLISSNKKVILTSDGKTVKDGLPLGFTFSGEDFKKCRSYVRKESVNMYGPDGKKISVANRYSARFFPLDKVFHMLDDSDSERIEVPWFYDISTWDGYRSYLGSDKSLARPEVVKYREWHKIQFPREEVE